MWVSVHLSEICDVLDSKRKPITKKDRLPGPYPYYGATGILDYVEGFLFDEQLVLIGEDGAKWGAGDNSAFKVQGKTWVNNHAHVIRPHRERVLDEWIIYYLNSEDLSDFITGLTVPKLNQGKLKGIPIPLPPIPEQKRIVAILDQAFSEIEKARVNAEQNLKNARELFDSYLQQVFSQHGEGWVESKLAEIVNVFDSLHKTPKYSDEGYPMVRVTDIKPGILDLSKTKRVDEATYEEFSKKYKAKIGDIVFSRVGSYGKSSIVATDELFCLGQNTVFLAPSIDGFYFYYFLNSPQAKEQMDNLVAGTTQPTVSLKSIKSLSIPVPVPEEQLSIVTNIDQFSEEIDRLEMIYKTKLNSLDELKKSLLQKAFSGELTQSKGIAA